MSDTDNLEIKKQARRRIVGAAALALIAAILLPIVMDGEPSPSGQDLDVNLPNINALPQTQVVPPVPQGTASPPTESDAPPARTQPVPAEPPATSTPAATPPSPPATASAQPSPAATPAAPAAASSGDGERARAILEGRAETQLAAVPGKSYVLQVAAFKDAPRAESLNTELRGQGYKSFVEKEGDFSRVRVGPFATKEEAEKAAASLRAAGRNTVLSVR